MMLCYYIYATVKRVWNKYVILQNHIFFFFVPWQHNFFSSLTVYLKGWQNSEWKNTAYGRNWISWPMRDSITIIMTVFQIYIYMNIYFLIVPLFLKMSKIKFWGAIIFFSFNLLFWRFHIFHWGGGGRFLGVFFCWFKFYLMGV